MRAWALAVLTSSTVTASAVAEGPPAPTMASAIRGVAPPAIEFRWDAPAECPDEAHVSERLSTILGQAIDQQAPGRTTAIARARRDPEGWNLRLWVISSDATRLRELRAESCELLADAAVLLAAMVLDPTAMDRAGQDAADVARTARDVDDSEAEAPPPQDPAAKDAPSDPVPARPDEPAGGDGRHTPPRRPRPKLQGLFRVTSGIEWGTVPGVGPPLLVGGGLAINRVRVDIELQHTFARSKDIPPDAKASFSLTSGIVRVGPRFSPTARLWLRPTAGVEVGALIGRARGLDEDLASGVTFAAVRLGGELSGALLPWLSLGVAAEGHIALARPSFRVESVGTVFQLPAGGVRGLAFLEFHGRDPTWPRRTHTRARESAPGARASRQHADEDARAASELAGSPETAPPPPARRVERVVHSSGPRGMDRGVAGHSHVAP